MVYGPKPEGANPKGTRGNSLNVVPQMIPHMVLADPTARSAGGSEY